MKGQFTTKHQAQNKRKHCWGCLKCPAMFPTKQTACLDCHSQVQYFPSQAEYRRFRSLQLEVRANQISDLELQPSFNVVLNSKKCFTYRADFSYTRGGQRVIEDVKGTLNEKYLDPVFKLKRKIVEAVYGISITIVK